MASYGESSSAIFKAEENLCADRFSSLPDAIAYRILSFVDLVDFDSLIKVSERWRRLCFTAPSLSMLNTSGPQDFLDDYFSERAKAAGSKIEQLRILVCTTTKKKRKRDNRNCSYDEHPVFRYLRKCVLSCDPDNVEINLLLREGDCCKPPLSVFLFRKIRNLALTMNNSPLTLDPVFRLSFCPDDFFGTPFKLQKLTLKSVKISSKRLGNMISQVCPELKVLRLYECTGMKRLVIMHEHVEHVEIIQEKFCDLSSLRVLCFNLKTLFITCYPQSLTGPKLTLSMPKVEHFELKGFPPLYYHVAPIYLHLKSTTIYCTWPTGRNLDDCYSLYLPWVLTAVRETKSLRLLARTIEILFRQLSKDEVLSSIKGVETLHIDDCYLTDDEVPAIACILKMMCNLKNIHVSLPSKAVEGRADLSEKKKSLSGFKMDYWEAQNLKFVQRLETATLDINNEVNAKELVKYFAKHGKRLKILKFSCPSAIVSTVSGQIESLRTNVRSIFIRPCTTVKRPCTTVKLT